MVEYLQMMIIVFVLFFILLIVYYFFPGILNIFGCNQNIPEENNNQIQIQENQIQIQENDIENDIENDFGEDIENDIRNDFGEDKSQTTNIEEFMKTPLIWYKTGNLVGQPIVEAIFKKYLGPERNVLSNYTPDYLNGLEYDCYDKQGKVAIEYNGIQHYEYTPYYHKSIEELNSQKERDIRKKQLALNNGDILIEIPCYIDSYRWDDGKLKYVQISTNSNFKKEDFWKHREKKLIEYLLPKLDEIYTII